MRACTWHLSHSSARGRVRACRGSLSLANVIRIHASRSKNPRVERSGGFPLSGGMHAFKTMRTGWGRTLKFPNYCNMNRAYACWCFPGSRLWMAEILWSEASLRPVVKVQSGKCAQPPGGLSLQRACGGQNDEAMVPGFEPLAPKVCGPNLREPTARGPFPTAWRCRAARGQTVCAREDGAPEARQAEPISSS